jgi:hypothetical protein
MRALHFQPAQRAVLHGVIGQSSEMAASSSSGQRHTRLLNSKPQQAPVDQRGAAVASIANRLLKKGDGGFLPIRYLQNERFFAGRYTH